MSIKKNKSRDFVSDYEKIRGLLRDIFIYGCFNADDLSSRQNISTSKYNQDLRKIRDIVDSGCLECRRVNNKDVNYFRINMFDATYNVLFDTYLAKSFADSEVRLYLKLMQIFSCCSGYMSQKELEEKLNPLENDSPESITVYRRLVELEKSGYLKKQKRKVNEYALSEDIFRQLNEDEFDQLIQAVDFLRNNLYPSVCGSFLHDTLKRYRQKRWGRDDDKVYFYFKHNHFAHVLDDEVLWNLLAAAYQKRDVAFSFQESQKDRSYKNVRPLAFFADEMYGRRYMLAGIEPQTSQTKVFRLDKIKNVKITKKSSGWDERRLDEQVSQQNKQSLTGGCDGFSRKPVKVGLQLHKSLVKRVCNEIGDLVINQQPLDEQKIRLELEVNDPVELKPWLRRYTSVIVIEENPEHSLREMMAAELEDWRNLYGIV
ncbi:MAG: hypothetical protein PWP16_330 [Eubacteriaceae bacterium]|jgi:predicted DNA-binding transcriptional regulator YafY|nr:hypothetical protein [Eubacteriaceae bacterium]MDK2905377.1 hypothetical protein [Eubacteriaceae bacterium]MDN5306967.1 hypothetical protein [Eubacteriaceae bacterium]